eukprot:CAMPEP_0182427534 /NCGR_PEP_ID=MMETSP1167-20130531/18191_1 /TAXON_ID=2988 /ORGANISM="Mallomonas Sp, Strain CCMP3275" /LENGTH=73 /DNA_ID=CAMNT_0024609841 /DNA_START=305 /DNA_END=526 /DNA_ORIENTATION=+
MENYSDLEPNSSCRSGSCGTCACKVNDPSGVVHDDEDMIDADKRAQGFIFSCTARLTKPGIIIELNQEDEYNA